MSKTRYVTIKLLEMNEEGMLNKDNLIRDLLNYMSEDEVKNFAESNDYVESEVDDD